MNSKNFISTKNMSREEWLLERRKGIGGSDVAAIFGANPWVTPLDVYNDKKGLSGEKPDTPKLRAGRKFENVIAEYYVEETGKVVQNDYKIRFHPENPRLLANMDKIILTDLNQPTGILECKTTGGYYFKTWDGEIPLNYYLQLQHYLMVTGYTWGTFAVMIDGYDFEMMYFERDEELINQLFEKLSEFWEVHIEGNLPPEPTNEADLKTLFPKSIPTHIEAKLEDYNTYLELKKIVDAKKEYEKKEKELKLALKLSMKDAEALMYDDTIICTNKSAKDSEKFNEEKFAEENPELYKKYKEIKPGSRRFLIK